MKTVSEDAVVLWYNQPASVFYEGQHKRTYFAWVTAKGEVQTRFYDHRTTDFSPIITLHTWEKIDDHAAPSLHVVTQGKNKGRIVVAFSFHSSSLMVRYSTVPEDIMNWSDQFIVYEPRASYPRLVELPNQTLALFFRSHPLENASSSGWLSLITSADGGVSWSPVTKVVDFGENTIVYAGPVAVRDQRLALAWTVFDIQGKRFNAKVFAAYSDDNAQTWMSYDGMPLGQFIDQTIIPIVSEDSSEQMRVWDVMLEPTGMLAVAYVTYAEEYELNIHQMKGHSVTFWQGEWLKSYLGDVAETYYASGVIFDPSDTKAVYFGKLEGGKSALVMQRTGQELWTLRDEGDYPIGYARPQVVKNASPELKLIFLGIRDYSSYQQFDTALLTLICKQ